MDLPPRALAALLLLPLALAGCLGSPAGPDAPADAAPERRAPPPGGPNQPPRAAFVVVPAQPVAGQMAEFIDQSTDPDDGIGGRVWQFPDGSTSTMAKLNRAFAEAGRYLVRLTVSDQAGQTDVATKVIEVAAPLVPGQARSTPAAPRPHAVIAVVDTGINPYHEAFRAPADMGPPAAFLPGYPVDAKPLPLTLGRPFAEARNSDEARWAGVEVGQLYWVPGTRIVGAVSFGLGTFGNAAPNQVPILDEDGHGTATSGTAALAAPDAYIVMVETGGDTLEQALAWAASQPWIDIVSVSVGIPGNLPVEWPWVAVGARDIPTRPAWDAGKLIFAAAGNEPSLSPTSFISGPSWVVSVGGVLPEGRGDPATASKGMDIVAAYTVEAPARDSVDAMATVSGTSFSAPSAAGTAAQALRQVRAHVGWTGGIEGGKLAPAGGPGLLAEGLTNQGFRSAIEGFAGYWATTAWQPVVGAPVAPAPWVQMGWGYLGPEDANALAQVVLNGQVPAKPAEAQAYMGAVQSARAAFWG